MADALSIGHEVLEAQRSLLRELASDIFPRFQAHPFYEALCEEIGPEWRYVHIRASAAGAWACVCDDGWRVGRRTHVHPHQSQPTTQSNPTITQPNRANRAKQAPHALRPGSIKKLLRRVKLPREFAVHRTALPSPSSSSSSHDSHHVEAHLSSPLLPGLHSPRSAGSSRAWEERLGQQPAARPMVDSAADWLMVFDTEFSPNMAIKVRTTRQIPVSGAYNRFGYGGGRTHVCCLTTPTNAYAHRARAVAGEGLPAPRRCRELYGAGGVPD